MTESVYNIEGIVISLIGELPELTQGTNLFEGPLRPIGDVMPATVCFVLGSGGPQPIAYQDGSDSSPSYREPRVQVMLRVSPGNYLSGKALSRKILKVTEKAIVPGCIGIRAAQALPIYVGQENDGSDLWSINLIVYQRS